MMETDPNEISWVMKIILNIIYNSNRMINFLEEHLQYTHHNYCYYLITLNELYMSLQNVIKNRPPQLSIYKSNPGVFELLSTEF